MFNRRALFLVLLAVVCTGLNALKPLHIDDAAYAYYSRQDATHPLDPYGFDILWYYEPQPALEVLAPPVLPYTWAAARVLFGERPWAWKWAMLPWTLLLVGSMYALLRRFAAGVELPLTVMTALSPAILPSINLMLDVPALALSLASVHLFLVACDRDSFGRAAAAGFVAGLAMQTKYTGAVAPAVMLLAAATTGRWRLWPAAAVAAAQVFLSWELLMALLYGQSHFLLSLRSSSGSFLDKGALAALFFSYLGGLAPFLVVLGMAALGVRRRWLAAAAALIVAGLRPDRAVRRAFFRRGSAVAASVRIDSNAGMVVSAERGRFRRVRGRRRGRAGLHGPAAVVRRRPARDVVPPAVAGSGGVGLLPADAVPGGAARAGAAGGADAADRPTGGADLHGAAGAGASSGR